MMTSVSRATVDAFFAAYATRDPQRIAPYLDDDVQWAVTGPVDLLPFCGERRGKAAVVELFERALPSVFGTVRMVWDEILIDGDRVAALVRLFATQRGNERPVSYRTAQFYRFRDEKIASFRAVFDSFNAAEQVHGQRLPFVDSIADHRADVVVL
ncbi:MAG: nuclear transport factor 2 family protein [Variibacter sp.]